MGRTTAKIIVSATIGLGLIATPAPADAAARAAPPACGNPAPVTAHDGSSISIWLGATCQDADLDHLTFEIVTAPEHGDLTEPEDAVVGYTPDAGYTGEDSFQFRADDGDEQSGPVTLAITVEPNLPPECEEDGTPWEVEPGTSNELWIYCFDPDDFGELSYTIVDAPQHGSIAAPEEFGPFTYTPEAGYQGPDSFTFTAGDGVAESDLVTVNLTVLPPNHPPTCVSQLTLRVAPGGSLPLNGSIACSDPDGDAIFPILVTGPRHGTLTIPNGVVTYTPDPGFTGTDRIDYRVEDERGATSGVAVLHIIVGDPPPPPVKKTTAAPDTLAPTASLGLAAGQRLRDVRKKGLKLALSSSEAGLVSVELAVSKATAKRLELKRKPKGRVLVGSAERTITAGSTTVSVALSRKARKALRRVAKVKLFVAAVVTDAAGNGTTVERTVKLRRR